MININFFLMKTCKIK
ncbi:unnamed protein product [Nezara viridula]|uniref:Uncharacterized protein n=1 Tax=Nezara viridula TaxID=85310 RepID=A0A9P0HLC1_NEZVI|nr:unnamed protein product [Nezara viridula]